METFKYATRRGVADGLPCVVETAFAWREKGSRRFIVGVNWSPGILNPFRSLGHQSLDAVLTDQWVGDDEDMALLIHVVHPRVEYTDRGKSAVVMGRNTARLILEAVLDVTKGWAKMRKAEDRDESRRERRKEILVRSRRETEKDVAWEVMEAAYRFVSGPDGLPAGARQIMYAARGEIQERTGKTLDDAYFTQTLLPDYIKEHPEAADWNVTFDARGHLTEPHTNLIVPLGTIYVRQYLDGVESHTVQDLDLALSDSHYRYPTYGPEHRFSAVLFIEKEGFMSLFKHVRLAERYDLGIMSTKGLSVVASRRLVDALCGRGKESIPLLVLHDFDKAGLSILRTLHQDNRRYEFVNTVNVIDLGLRLADVQAEGLQSESVIYKKGDPRKNLRKNGATEEEIQFLCSTSAHPFSGQRVELNAFASGQFIAWIESKLAEHSVKKVVPDEATLRTAYQRALTVATFRKRTEAMADEIHEEVMATVVPKNLRKLVQKRLTADDKIPWDQAMADLVQETVDDEAAGSAK
jgi:hypothetical protein